MNLLLFGAPGSGKGTQAEFLKQRFGIAQIATGDILRREIREGTELGRKAKEFMDHGDLVPDDVMIGIIRNRLLEGDCRDGCLLDGFPRTVPQAQALDSMMDGLGRNFDRAIYLHVDRDELVRRLSGRLTCPKCGRTYHPDSNPPRVDTLCDVDGTPLEQRPDDTPEKARKRIDVYLQNTVPVLDYYRSRGLVVDVDGEQPIDNVRAGILKAVA